MKLTPILFGAIGALLYGQLPPSSARAVQGLDLRHGLPSVFQEFYPRASPPKVPKVGGGPGKIPPAPPLPPGRPGGGSSSGGVGRPKNSGEGSSSGSANDGSGLGRPKTQPDSGNSGGASTPGKYEIGDKTPPPDTPDAFTAKVKTADGKTKDVSYFDQGRALRDAWKNKKEADTDLGAGQKLPVYTIVTDSKTKLGGLLTPELAGPTNDYVKARPATTLNRDKDDFVEKGVWGIEDGKGPTEMHGQTKLEPVSAALFSKDQNAIGIRKSTSTYDKDFPLASKDRLPQSELLFQNWKTVAGDKVADLKYVMHLTITNQETKNMVDAALKKFGIRRGQVLTIEARDTDPSRIAAFNALSGSDNGRAALKISTDHKNELGGIGPVKVHVFWEAAAEFPDLIWELGRVAA